MPKQKVKDRAFEGYTRGWFSFDNFEVCFSYWQGEQRMVRSFNFDWYFYLIREGAERAAGRLLDEQVDRVEPDGNYCRLYMPYYGQRRRDLIRALEAKGFQSLEADVTPVDRFIFERDVPISGNPRILYFDIETDTSEGGWEAIERHRVISVAFGSSKGDLQCLVAESVDDAGEAELLRRFLAIAGKYDVLVAWNSSNYDEPVVKARCKAHGISPNWSMVGFLDMMALFKRYYMRDEAGSGVRISFSLENIASTVLGRGKVEGILANRMADLLRDDPERLIEYNKRDVEILIELEERLGYIAAHAVLAKLCNRFLDDRALMSAYLVDGFVLNYAQKTAKMHFPTKKQWEALRDEENQKSIEGAFVMDPKLGLHRGICDLDFSSLYPSIVIAFNISPESKAASPGDPDALKMGPHSTPANEARFWTEQSGVFPAISRIALKARQEFKDEARRLEKEGKDGTHEHRMALQRSNAWKVLANSMFGLMSAPFSRYYDPECGEAITATGRTIMMEVAAFSETKGIEVIYGDTDSVFLRCSAAVAEEFAPLAVAHVDEWFETRGAEKGILALKLDAEFERILFTAKKRYAGRKVSGAWDVRGLELIRSDGCRYSREMQRRALTYLLEAANPNAKMARRIAEKWAHRLFSKDVEPGDLVLAQSLVKPIDEYKANTVHARIARDLLARGREVYQGMKIPYIVTGKTDGRLQAVHIDDFQGDYDAALYWKAKVYPPTQRILEAVFPAERAQWIELENYRVGGSVQPDLFELTKKIQTVTLRLNGGDQGKLSMLREACGYYPGHHPVRLEVRLEDRVVELMSEVRVKFVPELVKAMEGVVGHRIYFGSEDWDS